jgi:hypothetical protein
VAARFGQTVQLRDTYRAAGASVSVLMLDAIPEGSTLLREFVCEHIRATRTCARLLPLPASNVHNSAADAAAAEVKVNARPRTAALLYDIVYAEARRRQLAELPGVCASIVAALEARSVLARPRHQLELRCPPAATLEARALGLAQTMLPKNATSADDATRFCSADTDKALRSHAWRRVLKRAFRDAEKVSDRWL